MNTDPNSMARWKRVLAFMGEHSLLVFALGAAIPPQMSTPSDPELFPAVPIAALAFAASRFIARLRGLETCPGLMVKLLLFTLAAIVVHERVKAG